MQTNILILGAGPAGCAAALTARQVGLSVVMIDAQAETRRVPGETLHPGIEPIFNRLGVWPSVLAANFWRHRGIWKESEGRRWFEPYGEDQHGPWLGFQADRTVLQEILQGAAADAGVQILRACSPCALLQEGSRLAGLQTRESVFPARWVLDATGRRAWLAAALALEERRPMPPMRIRFGWDEEDDSALDGQPLFQQHHNGWDWHAPLGGGRSAWAQLRFSGSRADSIPALHCSAVMAWRLHQPCAGAGYFLLGDAAALLDPATSNGVLRALLSGILAVRLIHATQEGRLTEPAARDEFVRWTTNLFEHYAGRFRRLYHGQAAYDPLAARFCRTAIGEAVENYHASTRRETP